MAHISLYPDACVTSTTTAAQRELKTEGLQQVSSFCITSDQVPDVGGMGHNCAFQDRDI